MKDSLSSTNIYKVEQEKEYLRSSIRKKFKRLVEHAVYDLLKCKPKNKHKLSQSNRFEQQTFAMEMNPALFCLVKQFCKSLAISQKLRVLDLSGCNINQHFALLLSEAFRKNQSLQYIAMNGCDLSAFSLSCIFQAISVSKQLKGISLSNNQNFNEDVVLDFVEYILKGRNNISFIILSHCNIESSLLRMIFENLVHSKSLKFLKVNLMQIDSESLFGLRTALLNFNGNRIFDHLDISFNQIKDEGLQHINNILKLSYSRIEVRELNVSRNFFSQYSIDAFEQFIQKFKNLRVLDASSNNFEEFNTNQIMEYPFVEKNFLNYKKIKLNLSGNKIKDIPLNFFYLVKILDISANIIQTKGAYSISQVLSNPKTQWISLNLNDNQIKTDGFISIIYALVKYNTTLEHLMVANNNLDGHAVLYYTTNHEQINLLSLDLSRNNFRYQLIYALFNMMNESKLRTINVSSINEYQEQIQEEKELIFEIKSTQLLNINFSNNSSMIFNILKSLSNQYLRLETVDLSKCDLSQNELIIPMLNKFISKAWSLQSLNLSYTQLGKIKSDAMNVLASAFRQCLSLIDLNLCGNRLNQITHRNDLKPKSQNLKILLYSLAYCTNLKYLNLKENNIDESQYKILHHFLSGSHIQELILDHNNLSSQCLNAMNESLENNHQLLTLSLKQIKISGEHIQMLNKILQNDQLQTLIISYNQKLDKLQNLISNEKIQIINSLTLNHIIFNQQIFEIFLKVIKENRRDLKEIELHSIQSYKQCKMFFINLQSLTALRRLSLQYLLYLDSHTVKITQKNIQPLMLKLVSLSITSSILPQNFWEFLLQIVSTSQNLKELDLSRNFSKDLVCKYIPKIIESSKSIEKLYLQKCDITDTFLQTLIPCFNKNQTIKFLDLSHNYLSVVGFELLQTIENQISKHKLNIIILKHNYFRKNNLKNRQKPITLDQNQEIIQYQQQQTEWFDLSENRFDIVISIDKQYPNLHYLKLSRCNLQNIHCQTISQQLQQLPQLFELDLSENQIEDEGFMELIDKFQASNLQILNFSKNQIGNKSMDPERPVLKFKSLSVLNIGQNQVKGASTQYLIKMLTENKQLFIFNHWLNINEKLGLLILDSYIQLCQRYTFNSQTVPDYLQILSIEESQISDKFCQYFCDNFYNFPYLETISFSKSPFISMYGKVYLYLTIFQDCYQNFNLKHFYFDDVRDYPMLYDDGIWNFMLITLKNWIQFKKLKEYSQKNYIEIISGKDVHQFRGGNLGKFIILLINKLMKESCVYFTFSSNFMKYIQVNALAFKAFAIFHIVFQFIQIIIASSLLFLMLSNDQWSSIKKHYINQCEFQKDNYLCFVSRDYNQFLQYSYLFAAQLFPTVLVCLIDLNITIYLRKISDPDYKTLTPLTYNHFKSRFPHKKEILKFFLTIIAKLSYFIDMYLVMRMYRFYYWASSYDEQQDQKYFTQIAHKSCAFLYLMILITIIRFLFRTIGSLKAIKNISYLNPQSEKVQFLNAYWLNAQHQNNYIWEDLLTYFCPQSGMAIFGAYFNFTQISNLIQALLFELPQILIILCYHSLMQSFLYQQFDIWLVVGLAKCVVSFLVSFYLGLTIIHPRIKEQEFNSALFLRRFQKEKKIAKMHYKTERHDSEKHLEFQQSYQSQQIMSQFRGDKRKQIHFNKQEQKYEFKPDEVKSDNINNKSDEISIIFDEEEFVDIEASISNIKVQKAPSPAKRIN